MTSEASLILPNFSLEKSIRSPQELKETGYDGFGAIAVIVNEKNEILMVKESKSKDGDNKADQWGPVYETGNQHDDNPDITMIAGVASELGLDILNKLTHSPTHTYGYDFRRKADEAPSRSLISVFYLNSQDLPPRAEWGHEISDVRWMSTQAIMDIPESQLRRNAKPILKELMIYQALQFSKDGQRLSIPSFINPDFLASRTPKTDIHWTK